jgi:hypothetical protein
VFGDDSIVIGEGSVALIHHRTIISKNQEDGKVLEVMQFTVVLVCSPGVKLFTPLHDVDN